MLEHKSHSEENHALGELGLSRYLIAGVLGFTRVAVASAGIAEALLIFLVLA
jgi:hypothetical protein